MASCEGVRAGGPGRLYAGMALFYLSSLMASCEGVSAGGPGCLYAGIAVDGGHGGAAAAVRAASPAAGP